MLPLAWQLRLSLTAGKVGKASGFEKRSVLRFGQKGPRKPVASDWRTNLLQWAFKAVTEEMKLIYEPTDPESSDVSNYIFPFHSGLILFKVWLLSTITKKKNKLLSSLCISTEVKVLKPRGNSPHTGSSQFLL